MRSIACLGILLLFFSSCQQEEKVVFIQFDDSEGIHKNHQVLLNGVSVGTVLDVDVDITEDYQVLATVHLSDSIDFPNDSQFEIQRQDLFTKAIYVKLGKSEIFLINGDTIQGIRRSLDVPKQTPHTADPIPLLDEIKEMLRN